MTKGEESLEAVVTAGYNLFVKHGYHGTSMRQIAREAQLSPASLYNHVAGKEELFLEVLRRHHPYHQFVPVLTSAQGANNEDLVQDIAQKMLAVVKSRPGLINLLFIELVEFEARHTAELFRDIFPHFAGFGQRLEQSQGRLRPMEETSRALAFAGLIISQWILQMLVHGEAFDTSTLFNDAVDIFLHGILADAEA
ncbi:MAG: TetR/AcrR family transcriptional regulator [Chloroflexi bacterium]|nr:TetR/AcrR family transcriptional regulator [Chloroflexota bacterium]